jgi:peroxin-6
MGLPEPSIVSAMKECLDNLKEGWRESGWPVVLVGTVTDSDKIPISLASLFKQEILIGVSLMSTNVGRKISLS